MVLQRTPNPFSLLSRTCCYSEIGFDVEITFATAGFLRLLSGIQMWTSGIQQGCKAEDEVLVPRLWRWFWRKTNSIIYLDALENTPRACSFLGATARALACCIAQISTLLLRTDLATMMRVNSPCPWWWLSLSRSHGLAGTVQGPTLNWDEVRGGICRLPPQSVSLLGTLHGDHNRNLSPRPQWWPFGAWLAD